MAENLACNMQKDQLSQMYMKMLEIRLFEEKVCDLYGQDPVLVMVQCAQTVGRCPKCV